MPQTARKFPICDGLILYHPDREVANRRVSYNQEAYRILSLNGLPPSRGGVDPPPDLLAICEKWKRLLDRRVNKDTPSPGSRESCFIDLYQSSRRRYILRGCVLSHGLPPAEKQKGCYLFILERVSEDAAHLGLIFRKWNLSHREQEIVRFLLEDMSNKEIADTLLLSVHTVKAYLKLLTRKLGVSSRAGVIAVLLSGKGPSH